MNKQDFNKAIEKGVTCAITALLIIFCGLFIFYAGYKFGRERVLDNSSSDIVTTQSLSPQDTYDVGITSFESSNIGIPCSFFTSSVWADRSTSYSSSRIGLFSWRYSAISSSSILSFDFNTYMSSVISLHFDVSVPHSSIRYDSWEEYTMADVYGATAYVFLSYNLSTNFNFNIRKVVISSDVGFRGDNSYIDNKLTYYDSNDNTFVIAVGSVPQYNSRYELTTRTYFFLTDFTNNDYYQSGYLDGETAGILSGSQSGYNKGYSYGEQVGSAVGYQNGINDANTYTFGNLLTAVIDAPVNVFMSLLDFNIMGYNLLTIVTGLLTFAFIVLVVKLLLGGK